jgi:mRNA-degrading endonuclease RelE of RelBE toxin-antitoxin system
VKWAYELTHAAQKDLKDLPGKVRERVARTLDEMALDPFQGDVKALRGKEWKGIFRRRIGSYRILFLANTSTRIVSVVRILIRSEKTYR